MSHKKAHDKGQLPTNLRFGPPEVEPSYVPTIADTMIGNADYYGVGYAAAVDDAQDPGSVILSGPSTRPGGKVVKRSPRTGWQRPYDVREELP